MASHSDDPRVPRAARLAVAALLACTIALTAVARVTGIGTSEPPESRVVETRLLHFEDRADGAVLVRADAAAGRAPLDVLDPGTNGFARSVLRGLARERRLQGVGREPAFRLTRWADGRFSLDDPATGRSVELGAFGPSNAAVFARIFSGGSLE